MEKDLVMEGLLDKFRSVLENVETVKNLKKSLEQTQRKVDSLTRISATNGIPNESTKSVASSSKGSASHSGSYGTSSKDSKPISSLNKVYEEYSHYDTNVSLDVIDRVNALERALAYQSESATEIHNAFAEEFLDAKNMLTTALEQNEELKTANTELKQTIEIMNTQHSDLKRRFDNLNNHIEYMLGPIETDGNNDNNTNDFNNHNNHNNSNIQKKVILNATDFEELTMKLTTAQDELLLQNSKLDKLTKIFYSSTNNMEKNQDEISFLREQVRILFNQNYNHYLHDADPELLMKDTIISLLKHWEVFEAELDYSMTNLMNQKDSLTDDSFVLAANKLLKESKNIIALLSLNCYDNDETIENNEYSSIDLFDKLYPLLHTVVNTAEDLLNLDENSKSGIVRTMYTFNDIICQNGSTQLREYILRINDISKSALDLKIDKIGILRRVDHLEKVSEISVSKAELIEQIDKLKALLVSKADMTLVERITSTKASIKEFKKFKDTVLNEINCGLHIIDESSATGGTLRQSGLGLMNLQNEYASIITNNQKGNMNNNHENNEDGNGNINTNTTNTNNTTTTTNTTTNTLNQKLEALYREFIDLKSCNKQFVPRDEVNEALQSIIQEIKQVKVNSVSLTNFNIALKAKADDTQVQRLITALRGAMGNLEARTSSSAGYLRCLICDKPVNSVVGSTGPTSSNNNNNNNNPNPTLLDDIPVLNPNTINNNNGNKKGGSNNQSSSSSTSPERRRPYTSEGRIHSGTDPVGMSAGRADSAERERHVTSSPQMGRGRDEYNNNNSSSSSSKKLLKKGDKSTTTAAGNVRNLLGGGNNGNNQNYFDFDDESVESSRSASAAMAMATTTTAPLSEINALRVSVDLPIIPVPFNPGNSPSNSRSSSPLPQIRSANRTDPSSVVHVKQVVNERLRTSAGGGINNKRQ